MKKLLHERLRDEEAICECRITTDSGQRVIALNKREMDALAEEIEKYYIPRPRFEDGEPVQFGDYVDGCNGHVDSFLIYEDGSGTVYGEADLPYKVDDGALTNIDEPHKRPKPKVLDADGVPIKEDDTVYGMGREQHRYTVQIPYSMDNEDGERFCVQCYDHDDGIIAWCDPSMLTHREPDTLERVRNDMLVALKVNQTRESALHDIDVFADRLTALIERGA